MNCSQWNPGKSYWKWQIEITTIQNIAVTLVPHMVCQNTDLSKAIDNLNFKGLEEEMMDL